MSKPISKLLLAAALLSACAKTSHATLSVPGAPTGVTAVRGDQSATVSWTQASGSVSGYVVEATPGPASATTTGTSAAVLGLTNGTAYTFTVRALNGAGEGDPSAPSAPVTPAGVPSAPTLVAAVPGLRSAAVSWAASSPNGSAILRYLVTASSGATATATAGTSATVTGLSNGAAVTFTVTATNDVGTSAPSAPSAAVTTFDVPGAPAGVTATAGIRTASVSWTAPAAHGSAIAHYTVTASPGGATQSPTGTSASFAGLENGTTYTFSVTASNAVGESAAATASATTAALPAAPVVTASAGIRGAALSWTAPASSKPVTSYSLAVQPGGLAFDTADLHAALRALPAGVTQTVSVTARSEVGTGPAGSAAFTPLAGTWRRGGPSGGEIDGLAADPFDAATAWALSGGELFRSRDSGAHWASLNTALLDQGVFFDSVTADPATPGRLFATAQRNPPGEGRPRPLAASPYGTSVFKSDDRGDTWARLDDGSLTGHVSHLARLGDGTLLGVGDSAWTSAGGATWTAAALPASASGCQSAAPDPLHPGWAWLGCPGDVSVYRSTDSGHTFTEAAGHQFSQVAHVAVASDGAVWLAGWGLGVTVSTDGGATWTTKFSASAPDQNSTPTGLAIDARTGAIALADSPQGGLSGAVHVSTDGGEHWSLRTGAGSLVVNAVAFSASQSATSLWTASVEGALFSSDLGATFAAQGAGLFAHASAGFAIDALHPESLWSMTRYGQLFHSADFGASWAEEGSVPAQNSSYPAFLQARGGRLYYANGGGPLQVSDDLGHSWTPQPASGRLVALAQDPAQPQRLFAGTADGVRFSGDGGTTWTATPLTDQPAQIAVGAGGVAFALAANVLQRSGDDGASWTPLMGDLPSTDMFGFTVDPAVAAHLLVATADGPFVTVDGGLHWTGSALPDGLSLPGSLCADSVSGQLIYGRDPLVVSLDGGASFAPLAAPASWLLTGTLAVDPGAVARVYATGHGLLTLAP